jgi:hypothetical protein
VVQEAAAEAQFLLQVGLEEALQLVKVLEEVTEVTLTTMVVELTKQVAVLDTKLVAVAELALEDKMCKTLTQQ